MSGDVEDVDYRQLLEFRVRLRRFDQFSRDAAARAGLTHAQHQLLLAVRGHPGGRPTLGQAAEALMVKQNTLSELVDRTSALGLIRRFGDKDDHRLVRLDLTAEGERRLSELTGAHLGELRELAAALGGL